MGAGAQDPEQPASRARRVRRADSGAAGAAGPDRRPDPPRDPAGHRRHRKDPPRSAVRANVAGPPSGRRLVLRPLAGTRSAGHLLRGRERPRRSARQGRPGRADRHDPGRAWRVPAHPRQLRAGCAARRGQPRRLAATGAAGPVHRHQPGSPRHRRRTGPGAGAAGRGRRLRALHAPRGSGIGAVRRDAGERVGRHRAGSASRRTAAGHRARGRALEGPVADDAPRPHEAAVHRPRRTRRPPRPTGDPALDAGLVVGAPVVAREGRPRATVGVRGRLHAGGLRGRVPIRRRRSASATRRAAVARRQVARPAGRRRPLRPAADGPGIRPGASARRRPLRGQWPRGRRRRRAAARRILRAVDRSARDRIARGRAGQRRFRMSTCEPARRSRRRRADAGAGLGRRRPARALQARPRSRVGGPGDAPLAEHLPPGVRARRRPLCARQGRGGGCGLRCGARRRPRPRRHEP